MNKNRAEYLLGLCGCGSYDKRALRRAYLLAAKNNHPDVVATCGGDVAAAVEKMAEVNSAYEYLSDLFGSRGVDVLFADSVHYADFRCEDFKVKPEDYDIPAPAPEPVPVPYEKAATPEYSAEGFEFDLDSWNDYLEKEEAERQAAFAAAMAAPVKRSFWSRLFS